MQLVERRNAATLLPIVHEICEPGTIIHSDEWRAYKALQETYDHRTVNNSINFVCRETGTHTQNIESYWAKTKHKFKSMKGVDSEMLPGYLDERMWRDRYAQSSEDAMQNLLNHMAEFYHI